MTRIIAFCNQKGGTGKTTTCLNVSACLAIAGKRVLVVDADPQASLTLHCGKAEIDTLDLTTLEVMNGADVSDAIIDNVASGFDLIPSEIRLSGADLKFASVPGRELLLKDGLRPIMNEYDFIMIDCPPNLGVVTMNCLTVATEVIIPLQSNYLAVAGLALLTDTIELIRQRLNPGLRISGIVLTMFEQRTRHAREVEEYAESHFEDKLFETRIRKNVALQDASAQQQDIFEFDKNSTGASDYIKLTYEILGGSEGD